MFYGLSWLLILNILLNANYGSQIHLSFNKI